MLALSAGGTVNKRPVIAELTQLRSGLVGGEPPKKIPTRSDV